MSSERDNDDVRDDSKSATTDAHAEEPGHAGAADRRRELLRTAMIGGIGLTVTKWSTPIVESVILPAHAQATGGLGGSTSVINNVFPLD